MPDAITDDHALTLADLPESYALIGADGRPSLSVIHAEGFALILSGPGGAVQSVPQLERLHAVVTRALLDAQQRDAQAQRDQLAAEIAPRPGETPRAVR